MLTKSSRSLQKKGNTKKRSPHVGRNGEERETETEGQGGQLWNDPCVLQGAALPQSAGPASRDGGWVPWCRLPELSQGPVSTQGRAAPKGPKSREDPGAG